MLRFTRTTECNAGGNVGRPAARPTISLFVHCTCWDSREWRNAGLLPMHSNCWHTWYRMYWDLLKLIFSYWSSSSWQRPVFTVEKFKGTIGAYIRDSWVGLIWSWAAETRAPAVKHGVRMMSKEQPVQGAKLRTRYIQNYDQSSKLRVQAFKVVALSINSSGTTARRRVTRNFTVTGNFLRWKSKFSVT